MGYWWLALKDALVIGRDRQALLTLIFMPILLIGILGSAFGGLMSEAEVSIPTFKLGVVNLDQGKLGTVLENDVFKDGLPDLISANSMAKKELSQKLKEQKISVGVIIPENFSETIQSGKEANVEIISIPAAVIPSSIVENIILQFTQSAALNALGVQMIEESSTGQVNNVIQGEPVSFDVIEEVAIKQDQTPVSSFQYYAAGMGVMFLLMTVVTGVSAMIEEKEQDVYHRLLVTKLTNHQYLLGKFLGLFLMACLQFFVIIFGTSLLYGVDWGESMSGVILIGLSFVFSVCGLGLLLSALVKTEKVFSVAGMLGTQILAAVGGSMVPLYVFPDWLNKFVKIFPNALTLQTFLDLMSGGLLKDVLFEVAILLAIGLLSLLVAWMLLSAKRRMSHA
jgi:ABC-2 type transport system permease protein